MEYTKKHKNLLAKLFKKAGMMKEAENILSCDDYNVEIALAMRDAAGPKGQIYQNYLIRMSKG